MPRFARKLLAASLIALHAAVMLCGPCLHGLPGWGHESGLGIGIARVADGEHVGDPIKSAHVQPDDCPICHFFSQAQLPTDPASAPMVQQAAVLKLETLGVSAPFARLHPTSPRAPPASNTATRVS